MTRQNIDNRSRSEDQLLMESLDKQYVRMAMNQHYWPILSYFLFHCVETTVYWSISDFQKSSYQMELYLEKKTWTQQILFLNIANE